MLCCLDTPTPHFPGFFGGFMGKEGNKDLNELHRRKYFYFNDTEK